VLVLEGDPRDAGRAAVDASSWLAATGACAGASVLPRGGIGLKMLGDAAVTLRETLLQAGGGCPRWLTAILPA
jgi:hypothetical protein